MADRHRRKFCSPYCFGKYNRPKGSTPWNKGLKLGISPPNYKGENVSYSGLHHWVKYHLGSPKVRMCVECKQSAQEWANISGVYKRVLTDWQPMCIKCHRRRDNVVRKSWVTRKSMA